MTKKSFRPLMTMILCFSLFFVPGCANMQPRAGGKIPKAQPFSQTVIPPSMVKQRALLRYISKRTVRVVCMKALVNTKTNKVLSKHMKCGWGTGTIIRSYSDFSYVLTAYHVVDNITKPGKEKDTQYLYYYLIERRTLDNKIIFTDGGAKRVAIDLERDLAVLKVPKSYGIQSSFARKVVLGDTAHMVGYPWLRGVPGSNLSYSKGVVGTMWIGNDKNISERQHDRFGMEGYFGNSGGAIWNSRGEIIGMANWITGWKLFGYGFIPQQNQLYGCSSRGMRNFLNKSEVFELRDF